MQMLSTPPTGHFDVEINGKRRNGKMTMAQICKLETELGFSVIQALRDPERYWGFNTIATVLWVGLSAINPRITKDHVTDWMGIHLGEGGTLEPFISASQEAVFIGMGKNVKVGNVAKKALRGELLDPDAPFDEAAADESGDKGEEDAEAEPTPLEGAPTPKKRRSA